MRSPSGLLRACLTGALLLVLAALAGPAGAADKGKNLVFNPSFDKKDKQKPDDPMPFWTVRSVSGTTSFRVEKGVLVAERTSRSRLTRDSVSQLVNLPARTDAVRVGVKAGCEGAEGVEIVLRYKGRDGGPLGRMTLFRLSGDEKMRLRERDVRLPAGTRDVEIEFVLSGPGRATFDDVDLRALADAAVRGEALVLDVHGTATFRWTGRRPEEPLAARVRIASVCETQGILSLEVTTDPGGKIVSGDFHVDDGFDLVRLRLEPLLAPEDLTVHWTARVVLLEREGFRNLPETLKAHPARHLPRNLEPFLFVVDDPEVLRIASRTEGDRGDLRKLSRAVARLVGAGNPNRATDVFRACGVPARRILLVEVRGGAGLTDACELYQKEEGWLRFGLTVDGPCPRPFQDAVRLAGPPEGPGAAVGAFRVDPLGSFVLPNGAGPDLASSLATEWAKAARRSALEGGKLRAAVGKPALRGKAKKVKGSLETYLRADEGKKEKGNPR
jgi:hypothetical protein